MPTRTLLAVFTAFLLGLTWPAALNGGPFWHPDTSNYIRAADAAFVVVTGSPSEWSDRLKIGSTPITSPSKPGATTVQPTRPVLKGRSIYYGALLYLPIRWFGPLGAVFFQCSLVAATLSFILSIVSRAVAFDKKMLALSVCAISLASPLPLYSCTLMPDVWTGIFSAFFALALFFRRQFTPVEFFAALVISAILITFHTTNLLLALPIAFLGITVTQIRERAMNAVFGAIIVTSFLVANFAFDYAVTKQTGAPPISPPFLTARLVDQGPGNAYLENHCFSPSSFEICRYRGKLPKASDNFLWSQNRLNGVFQIATPTSQRLLAAQDKRFFVAVALADPLRFIEHVAVSSVEGLADFSLRNFNLSELNRSGIDKSYPPMVKAHILGTRAYAGTFPLQKIEVLCAVGSMLSVFILIYALMRAGKSALASQAGRYVAVLLVAIFANALICGAFSKPDARYTMRMLWLLPFAAGIAVASTGQRVMYKGE